MILRKAGYLLRSTDEGQIGWAYGLWLLLLLGVFLCASVQMQAFQSSSQYMEDALALSNLAAIVIDVEEYGTTHTILIDDAGLAWTRYQNALRGNLGLNEDWECPNKELISGPVQIENFTVYNVREDSVEITTYQPGGSPARCERPVGTVCAPNGKEIVSTGVYSEISYPVRGMFGMEIRAHKGKLADIAVKEGS